MFYMSPSCRTQVSENIDKMEAITPRMEREKLLLQLNIKFVSESSSNYKLDLVWTPTGPQLAKQINWSFLTWATVLTN